MCGICGIHSSEGPPDIAAGLAMMGALSHRGPDGSGYMRDRNVLLGHTRLAIVDMAGGAQPMTGEDESVWVTFNGEIFNHVELRDQLTARGHRFRTRCDTEAIVHAWEEWGPDCFRRFNGQWAVAIWDRKTATLTLSRDRLGVRPLYYTRAGGRLLFASECKALFTDRHVQREIDTGGLAETFTFWSPLAPRTIFAGVGQLPPGNYATVAIDGTMTLHEYWAPSYVACGTEPPRSMEENAELLRQAVIDATRLRFERADVPVGAYLSGGLDSAVTASAITRFTAAPLHTFSLRFADREFDEGDHQQHMVAALGATHHEIVVSERDVADAFPDVVRHAETALLRSGPAPMFLLSRLVRDAGFSVVVTGEGADEVLAGYDIFREARARAFVARDPSSARRSAALDLLYPWLARSPKLAPAFAKGFFQRGVDAADPAMSHRPRWAATGALAALLTPDARGDAAAAEAGLVADLADVGAHWDPLSRAQWLEMRTLLPGYILSSQGDRMLMAHSVEGRFPFLDPHVVDLAATFPGRQRMLALDEKHVLKRAFADLVPSEILQRPKQPYRSPDGPSFFAHGSPDWLDDVTGDTALADVGLFRPEIVARLIAKFREHRGRAMSNTDNMRLIAVLSVQLLHQQFVRSPEHSRRPPAPVVARDLLAAEEAKP